MRTSRLSFPLTLLAFFVATQAAYGQQQYGITAFGTDQISADQIRAAYTNELDRLLVSYENDFDQYKLQRKEFIETLQSTGDFSYVSVYLLKSYAGNFSFIIDYVEPEDASSRLNYREVRLEDLDDPDQLLAKWNEYEELSNELFQKGEIKDMNCPVFHCTWSFNHPQLKPFLTYFQEHVPANKDKLANILHHSDTVQFRADSAFLLAHADIEAAELVELLLPAIRDPESWVRNNSMRVIYYVVKAFEEIKVDVDDIIEALDYPSFTDRNKALVILRSLPLTDLTDKQLRAMASILLEILVKNDAHNRSTAVTVLKKISGKDYSGGDIANWKRWANSIKP